MQRQCEASKQPNCRAFAAFLAPLLALVSVSTVWAAHAENWRLDPTAVQPLRNIHPAAIHDDGVPPALVPARLPAGAAVPRRLPPVVPTQALSLSVERIDCLDNSPATKLDLQLPGNATPHIGGWMSVGFGAGGLAQ